MRRNPFCSAQPTDSHVKAFCYAEPGVGKSHLSVAAACALAAAVGRRAAVLSCEGGVEYLPAKGYQFDVLRTGSIRDVVCALDYLESAEGRAIYGAVVLDGATTLYMVAQETMMLVVERRAKRCDKRPDEQALSQREWGRIKQMLDPVAVRLMNLPMHVFVTVREGAVYGRSGRGGELEVIGAKPQMEKGWAYTFDIILRLFVRDGVRYAYIDKDRWGVLGAPFATIADPSEQHFMKAALVAGTDARVVGTYAMAKIDADRELRGERVAPETLAAITAALADVDVDVRAKAAAYLAKRGDGRSLSEAAAQRCLARLQAQATGGRQGAPASYATIIDSAATAPSVDSPPAVAHAA